MQALIIGGTKGLGRALADQCQNGEIFPIITGRTLVTMHGMIEEYVQLDLCDEESIDQAVKDITKLNGGRYGEIRYVFWAAGAGLQGRLVDQTSEQIEHIYQLTVVGPTKFFSQFFQARLDYGVPLHLVTIASSSAWRTRSNETVYGGAKAAQAQTARNLQQELSRDIPGSISTLILPGGMKTPFWDGSSVDTSKMMDPDVVAAIIMEEVLNQQQDWQEVQIIRGDNGRPIVEYGAELPR